jgi:hypothetical protein
MIWLASYPKSGNTWLRVFLSHLTVKDWNPDDLNSLPITIAANRALFDRAAGIEASGLTHAQIELLRPRVYEQMAATPEQCPFLKTHDAWTMNAAGEPVLSTAGKAAVYLVRNPFDVAVSFAHHQGKDAESVIESMEDPANTLCGSQVFLPSMLPTRLLTWEGHVRSWLDVTVIPVRVIRYEDMKARPLETFTEIVRFCGLEFGQEDIGAALHACAFERLQELERKNGFRERLPGASSFFRKGVVGSWREALTDSQVQRLIAAHGKVMRRLGYLDASDNPLC